MRYSFIIAILGYIVLLQSCKQEHIPGPVPRPPSVKPVLLKDITIPNLPSPYYHFEYNTDSLVTRAEFSSGLTSYNVLYSGKQIKEMRNNVFVNQDTLRYVYDNTGKVALIKFIDAENTVYRHVSFLYNGSQIKEIEWDHKEAGVGFLIDRTLTFTYYPDGNVKTITEIRPAFANLPEHHSVKTFDQYDSKINVDDFSLIHDGIHDHLFLGVRLQKGNPKKERLEVNGVDLYTIDYVYSYNNDNTPATKKGDFLYLSGPNAGQRFQTNAVYTYY